MNKIAIIEQLEAELHSKLDELVRDLDSIKVEMANETKSSAGDKFETAREMMNQERDRLAEQLSLLQLQLNQAEQLKRIQEPTAVEMGTLVDCGDISFLFGLAYGKIIWQEIVVQVLSLNSPLGKAFHSKKAGDCFTFNKQEYYIKAIY